MTPLTGKARPGVFQVEVVVNGGSVEAKCRRPKWAMMADDAGSILEGSRVVSDADRHNASRAQRPLKYPSRPVMRDFQPLDLVEERAVAALLTSMRSQRTPHGR